MTTKPARNKTLDELTAETERLGLYGKPKMKSAVNGNIETCEEEDYE